MAITVERMVAVLEARMDQFDKSVAKSRAQAVGDFTAITDAGTKMENSLGKLGANGKKGLDNLNKSTTALKGQTGNLAAQFNDIGVQLAGGQSPFLIALQQGSQISQVLGPGGAKGAAAALGGAFVSLLNPISLATIAAITLGGTVIQYFSSLISEGEKSEETLKAQADLVDAVVKKWGEALPALKAYNDEQDRAKASADIAAGGQIGIDAAWEKSRAIISDVNVELVDVKSKLKEAGNPEAVRLLEAAFASLTTKISEGTATTEDAKLVQTELASSFTSAGIPAVDSMVTALATLSEMLGIAAGKTRALKTENDRLLSDIALQEGLKNSTLPALDPLGFINPDRDQTNRANATKSQTQLAAEAAAKASRSGSSTESDALDSATKSLEERTKALDAQFQAQSKLNPLINDYGYAVEFAKAKQELLTAAEKAKKDVTPQMAADIDKLSAAYARTSAELQKLAEENKKAAEAIAFQKDLVNGALSDMRTALEDGKLTWEDLGNVAVNVLNKIADKLQQMLVDQLFAKGFGGLWGALPGVAGAVVGGVSGAGGTGAVSKAAGLSQAPPMPRLAAAKSAQAPLDVRVSVDDDGKVQAYVRREGGKVLAASKAGLDKYAKGQGRTDARNAVNNPRRV